MNALAVRLAAVLLVLAATGAQAGGPLSICNDAAKTPLAYSPATVNLNYDLGNLGTRTNAQANAIVTNAVALWTNVGTATITIGRGADLPVDVTTANYTTYLNQLSDGLNPVIYDTDGSIIDLFFGSGMKNSVLGFAGSEYFTAPTCRYAEGEAVINGFIAVTDTTMSVVLAHEIGHLIGMDHTQLDDTQGLVSAFPSNYPLMYPIAYRDFVSLHEDDIAAVSALYPDATLNSVYGQISGTFVLADGVTPVLGANLWATETTTNKLYSIVSDYRTQGTGYFKLLLPAGTYNLRAEAIQLGFDGGSSVGPYSKTSADASFQPPLYSGITPMATVTLGNATPTSFVINPGCVAALTFWIDGTGSVGVNCSGSVFTLTVSKSGSGTGTVTSSPAGIACGADCSESYATGASVTLTATPAAGSTFAGWSSPCSGTGTCTVTMNSAKSVTATFALANDGFPSGGSLPAGWIQPFGSNAPWFVTSDAAYGGSQSLKSGLIGNSQKSEISYTANFAAGNVSFARKVSSELNYDFLEFYIDGVLKGSWSGERGWSVVSFPVSAGTHTLLWRYVKDVSFIEGSDAAWIDSFSGTVTVSCSGASCIDLAVTQTVTPNPANAGKDVVYQLTVSNSGPASATGVGLTDTLPAGTSFVWASPGCTNAAGIVTCSIGSLANAASSQVTVVVRPSTAGSITNNATVSGTQSDSNNANNTSANTLTVNSTPAGTAITRYRLYSDVTKEHLFTTDLNEYTVLGANGWNQEGTVGKVLNNPGVFNGVTAVPYYRLYNPGTRWHHWSTDANEYYTLVLFGWTGEGVDGYILLTSTTGAIELYRLVFNAIAGLHHWTIDTNEYSVLTTSGAWRGEPGAGFVIQ